MTSSSWITTERFTLDHPTDDDVGAVLAIMSDTRVVHHNPSDFISGLDEAEAVLERWMAHWETYGFGYAPIRRHGESAVVGFCGVTWAALPPRGENHALNLMYRLKHGVWGEGIATETSQAVMGWALHHHPETTVMARVTPGNDRSIRVLEKLDLRRDGARDSDGPDGLDWIYTTAPLPADA